MLSMRRDYFPNKDGECFGSAVANALLLLEDNKSAERFFDLYRLHPYVDSDGGSFALLWPKILNESTYGKYEGKLYIDVHENLEQLVKEQYPKRWKEVLRMIEEEKSYGRVVGFPEELTYFPPAIILAEKKGIPHAILDASNMLSKYPNKGYGTFIDNGIERTTAYKNVKMRAIMEVKSAKAEER